MAKATARNASTKRTLKSAVKTFQAAIKGGKKAAEAHSAAQSALDKAGKKNVMHKNKIARKKRQMAKAAKAANQKIFVKSSKVKVATAVKKPTTKKAAAKKPAAKKPAAKKAAKKTTTKKK